MIERAIDQRRPNLGGGFELVSDNAVEPAVALSFGFEMTIDRLDTEPSSIRH